MKNVFAVALVALLILVLAAVVYLERAAPVNKPSISVYQALLRESYKCFLYSCT
jgi:hypothetical protein